MSHDFLPEWLDLFLDDVETTLCLPILLVMVFCTVQFIINHTMDIGCTIYQNIQQKSDDESDEDTEKEQGPDILSRIKGFFYNLTSQHNATSIHEDESLASQPLRPNCKEEEWDYCEEDDE
ncbi:uncharacterized protein LOC122396628 [Colletes gigas]|uniref:uncharacterized protein LOC122396628 n=1 Tax=Colletes gigas TaxID=935657 RepID=UPI001C9A92FE|nr:uncharacterized protein LOC122396628 [Colletes gigas]